MAEAPSLQAVIHACLADADGQRRLSPRHWQVCRHILDCRTPALGGFALECDGCGDRPFLYHACRDRHCPRCQRRASQDWCERQRAAVLPVTYHHLVFTLPHDLDGWVEVHPKEVYDLLFEAVWATLSAFGADPKRLDGQLGMTAVLHTWGQTLVRHVHLHCLVPGGALGADGSWHPATSTYLFPVRALSRHFRGGFVSRLRRAFEDERLPRIRDRADVEQVLEALIAYSAETGQPFQRKLDTQSAANWTAVPDETGQSERSDARGGCCLRVAGHLRQCWVALSLATARVSVLKQNDLL